jgi:RecB family exonuclease
VHADAAFGLAGLPSPVPDDLPGPAHSAEVHNTLAGWWRLPLERRTVAAAGTLVDRGWIDEGFADETQSVRQRERSIAMVEGYVAGLDPADEPIGVERTVATRTDKIAVSGRIDRLDLRLAQTTEPAHTTAPAMTTSRAETIGPAEEAGPELVVVDYKTGRHLLTVDDTRSSMALALYALAAGRALRRPCHRVELHHLPTGEVLAWSHTDAELARHLSRAEDIAEECAAADERMRDGLPADRYDEVFPPRPSPSYGWCDFRRHCPEGAAAAIPRRPWDGLAPT